MMDLETQSGGYQKANTIERERWLSPMVFANHIYFFQIFYRLRVPEEPVSQAPIKTLIG
ncbi:hypothetical protein HDF13_003002 [Edaphobacter lichenicola]|uniref:Uncharacterized protein n=1 Tax=Tunturiibacter gelidiferens TaxID=3069689 RepID=A0ACC5P1F0_9BACT|nr:hypothetical protein [Edaphobacter lichenicola]